MAAESETTLADDDYDRGHGKDFHSPGRERKRGYGGKIDRFCHWNFPPSFSIGANSVSQFELFRDFNDEVIH